MFQLLKANNLKIKLLITFVLFVQLAISQVYMEKQSRHRFAQLNLGVDLETSFGGNAKYIDANGNIGSTTLKNNFTPRFLIGGTHFWGHADFYIGIPLYTSNYKKDNQEIISVRGVETAFKYYPLKIENKKIRPFVGFSISPFLYTHRNNNLQYASGPELNYTNFPVLGGLTYNSKNHLIDLGFAWNYSNTKKYYIDRDKVENITTSPVYATIAYRYMIESTLSAEKDWESGRTKEVTNKLAEAKRLNGLYFGIGLSSAFWLNKSSYNSKNRPYIEKYSIATMPDFSLGYYLHKPDMNFAFAYRGYKGGTNSYGTIQHAKRKSFLFETTKFLFDYHGFVPFIGPTISHEELSFNETHEDIETINKTEKKLGYGVTFGWDIRPNRLQSWVLRTNLRWYPNLNLDVAPSSSISFNNMEFNFIQLIIYPNRIIKFKRKD